MYQGFKKFEEDKLIFFSEWNFGTENFLGFIKYNNVKRTDLITSVK